MRPGNMRPGTACFLDFDHTLFNTDEFFHVDVRHSFLHLGIDEASWEESYAMVWHTGYTLEKHAEEIERQRGSQLALGEMRRILVTSFSDLRRYLFPDVVRFLERGKQLGVGLYLLSFGDPEWQRYKVLRSHVGDYFEHMFFSTKEGRKAELIVEQAREFERVLVVDNNATELDSIRDLNPAVQTYWINRVPDEMRIPSDELVRLKFLEARRYLGMTRRHQHGMCRTLDEVLSSCER